MRIRIAPNLTPRRHRLPPPQQTPTPTLLNKKKLLTLSRPSLSQTLVLFQVWLASRSVLSASASPSASAFQFSHPHPTAIRQCVRVPKGFTTTTTTSARKIFHTNTYTRGNRSRSKHSRDTALRMADFDDEFGDDSFLNDLDLDAAIAKHLQGKAQKQTQKSPQKQGSGSEFDLDAAIAKHLQDKTQKSPQKQGSGSVTKNPYKQSSYNSSNNNTEDASVTSESSTSRSTMGVGVRNPYATKKQPQQQQHPPSPFGPSSNFSMGTKTNPNEFISPYTSKHLQNPYNNNHNKRPSPLSTTHATPAKKQQITPTSASNANTKNSSGSTAAFTTVTTPPLHNNDNDDEMKINPKLKEELTKSLNKYFGHTSFRKGQLSIIHALLQGKDSAVFWSTGSGKSLCYQLPPLHTGKIAIIVSPLISLMEDQVAKLNGLLMDDDDDGGNAPNATSHTKDMAVFLGSGQMDPMAESRALNGQYSLIYITPEKLCGGDGYFINQLAKMHEEGKMTKDGRELCLIAIDESHCVSEWGHDFRRDYRQLGSVIRSQSALRTVPIVALTATAVPRVQHDIIQSLQLKKPKVVKHSFDRDNLVISVKRKPDGGHRVALAPFVKEMKEKRSKASYRHAESTIIYCPTKNNVEDIAHWLSNQFRDTDIQVEPYHAGLSNANRSLAHVNFLTGKTSIIVATLAFGMGIDKTDTRRIIHYGPPKTVEEYYQQIGRAGRDGVESYCTMYCNDGDFNKYKSDFYLGGLKAEAKASQEASIDALRRFALNDEVCRRAEILKFFHEIPHFGERCGTCDTCVSRANNANDIERDFAENGARLVLYAISVLNSEQGTTQIEKILKGNSVDTFRYRHRNANATSIKLKVQQMRDQMEGYKKRVPVSYFSKDLLPVLLTRGFVETQTITKSAGGFNRSWAGHYLTSKGLRALDSGPIVLPVPASIREYEKQQAEKVQKSLDKLKMAGADIDQIPQHELDEGDGEVFKALTTWYNYLERLERNERTERIDQLEDLRLRIDGWRMDVATKFRISPADAMPDHLLLSIAYTTASAGVNRISKDVLLAAGVRSGGIDILVETLNEWISETKPQESTTNSDEQTEDSNVGAMILPDETFTPNEAWEYFNYRPQKKTGLASWESSYIRFTNGEHPQTIAISPANGRPIQVNTVIGHIFEGILSGRPVNLHRVGTIMKPPNKSQWDMLASLEEETGVDVSGDPKTCGINGEPFRMTDFLAPIMGDEFNSKEFADRTPEEKEKFGKWCELLKWYMSLRKIQYTPRFEK